MDAPQFNLNALLSTPLALQNVIKDIPCEQLVEYHNHCFSLYEGERMEDMVASIKENGILSPLVVQPLTDESTGVVTYEILIGHNRWKAAQTVGFATVPAIVKEGLTEAEAEMYVIESNVMQRGFDNLKISEQAHVIATRKDEMFSQGKRTDILAEIAKLERIDNDENGEIVSFKIRSNKTVGEEYGLCSAKVIRLARIDKLVPELKKLIDEDIIAIRSGVDLSFLCEETQKEVAKQSVFYKVDMKKATLLKVTGDNRGYVAPEVVTKILDGTMQEATKSKSISISTNIYAKYFPEDMKAKEVTQTIEKALEYYFNNRNAEQMQIEDTEE